MPNIKAQDGSIAISLYAYLWGKFESFSAPLTMEQQTDLDGLLSDIAGEIAAKFPVQAEKFLPGPVVYRNQCHCPCHTVEGKRAGIMHCIPCCEPELER